MVLITISAVLIIVFGVSLFKRAKRKLISPDVQATILERKVRFYRELDPSSKLRFVAKVNRFLETTRIEGVGTQADDIDKVLVAASAVIPIFNFGDWEYRNISNVILYPDTFNHEFQYEGEDRGVLGMVGTGFMNGQMILSKSALHKGFQESGGAHNTAIHEFIHLLDKADGYIDGIPELLLQNSFIIPWVKAMEHEIRRIKRGTSDIDPYALTNEAEFFAVVAEYFFENPTEFQEKHPELYSILDKMFNPDGQTNIETN